MRPVLAVVLFIGSTGPALADLTAEDVLADQLNLLSFYGGLEMETTAIRTTPDGLVVDGFRGRYSNEENGNVLEVLDDGVELIEQEDGSVRIVYPERYAIRVMPEDDDPATVTLALEDVSHVISGSKEALQHDLDAKRISLADIAGPATDTFENLDATITFDNLDSTLQFVEGVSATRNLTFVVDKVVMAMTATGLRDESDPPSASDDSAEVEGIDFLIDLTGAEGVIGHVDSDVPQHLLDVQLDRFEWRQMLDMAEGEGLELSMQADDFAVEYDVSASLAAWETAYAEAIRSGQFIRGGMRYARVQTDMDVSTTDGPFSMESSNGRTEASFSLDGAGLDMSLVSEGTVANVTVPPMPFPVSEFFYEIDAIRYAIKMPLLASEQAQDFGIDFALEGFKTSDVFWSLFDPDARLPRDPIDIVLDVSGTAVVTEDPTQAEDGTVPFSQTEATLNALRLAVAGAVLTGEGAFADTSTPDKPGGIGTLSAMLTGGNTLLDTLVDMGLVDSEQAGGARMMLGVVARPGDGPDTLVSEIEVNEEGHIFANGQRIK